jgi:ssDNA-binding Zn-finger/Zn-ribbon topoisomerase 1
MDLTCPFCNASLIVQIVANGERVIWCSAYSDCGAEWNRFGKLNTFGKVK